MTEFGFGLFCVPHSETIGFSRVPWVNLVLKRLTLFLILCDRIMSGTCVFFLSVFSWVKTRLWYCVRKMTGVGVVLCCGFFFGFFFGNFSNVPWLLPVLEKAMSCARTPESYQFSSLHRSNMLCFKGFEVPMPPRRSQHIPVLLAIYLGYRQREPLFCHLSRLRKQNLRQNSCCLFVHVHLYSIPCLHDDILCVTCKGGFWVSRSTLDSLHS